MQVSNMNIVEWSADERPYFEYAKQRWGDPLAYEESWLYLYQALRRGGWVCRNAEGWMAIARDYLGYGHHAVVVPLSQNLSKYLPCAMTTLSVRKIRPEVVKHIPIHLSNSLLSSGDFVLRQHSTATEDVFLEDLSEDSFPQVLVNIDQAEWEHARNHYAGWIPSFPRGPQGRNLRQQVRRFYRLYLNKDIPLKLEPIIDARLVDLDAALSDWCVSARKRFALAGRPRVRGFESCFLEPVQAVISFARRHPDDAVGFLIKVSEKPSGLWIGTRISEICFSINVLLADTTVNTLSDFTLYLALLQAQKLGAKWVNLGGSELESLFRFKRKVACRKAPNGYLLRQVVDVQWRG